MKNNVYFCIDFDKYVSDNNCYVINHYWAIDYTLYLNGGASPFIRRWRAKSLSASGNSGKHVLKKIPAHIAALYWLNKP